MSNTEFSIIMPTYNRAFCIENAINSLLAQTYQKFELIIVDDGSNDNTEELIKEKYAKELKQGKILYKKLKKNKGVCNARNLGLRLTKNKWIGYLDTDNTITEDYLETFKNAIENNPKNKTFYAQLQFDTGRIIGKPFDYKALCKVNYIDMGVFVHHRSLVWKCGKFDTKLKRLVDWDLIIRYTKRNNPYFIEKVLLKYSSTEKYARISNTENLDKAEEKIMQKIETKPLERLFSVKNSLKTCHKVITICGLQIKLKSKKLKQEKEMKNFQLKINAISATQQKIVTLERENFYANVLRDSTYNSSWLIDKAFTLTGGAANYSLMFTLFRVLEDIEPTNILEFGLGQTSKVTTQYVVNKNPNANLTIVEHDQSWIDIFSKKLSFNDKIQICQKDIINSEIDNIPIDKYDNLEDIINNKKFNLIVIDGPFGFDRIYPRTNILDLIPNNLADNFVIILDDAERDGEKNTANLIFEKLEKHNIKYLKSYKTGVKTQLLITSTDYNFIHWI